MNDLNQVLAQLDGVDIAVSSFYGYQTAIETAKAIEQLDELEMPLSDLVKTIKEDRRSGEIISEQLYFARNLVEEIQDAAKKALNGNKPELKATMQGILNQIDESYLEL